MDPKTKNNTVNDIDSANFSSSCNAMRWVRKPWKHVGHYSRQEAIEILADRYVSQKRRVQMRGCVRIIYYCHVQRSHGCRYEMNVCVPNDSQEKLRIDDINEHTCNHEEARLRRRVKPKVADFDRPFKKAKGSEKEYSSQEDDLSYFVEPALHFQEKTGEAAEASEETNAIPLTATASANEHLANLFTTSLINARQKLIWKEVDIDILDFSNRPDGSYKYVFHATDKGSQYSYAIPLVSIEPQTVCESIKKLFFQFGPPITIYVEENSKVIEEELRKFFPTLNVQPYSYRRKSTSTSCLRREAALTRDRILAWLMENNTTEWSKNLAFIKYTHNTEWLEELESSPMDLFFNRNDETTEGHNSLLDDSVCEIINC